MLKIIRILKLMILVCLYECRLLLYDFDFKDKFIWVNLFYIVLKNKIFEVNYFSY